MPRLPAAAGGRRTFSSFPIRNNADMELWGGPFASHPDPYPDNSIEQAQQRLAPSVCRTDRRNDHDHDGCYPASGRRRLRSGQGRAASGRPIAVGRDVDMAHRIGIVTHAGGVDADRRVAEDGLRFGVHDDLREKGLRRDALGRRAVPFSTRACRAGSRSRDGWHGAARPGQDPCRT